LTTRLTVIADTPAERATSATVAPLPPRRLPCLWVCRCSLKVAIQIHTRRFIDLREPWLALLPKLALT
jgi:hypothetical protein